MVKQLKDYTYLTGNVEAVERINKGEDMMLVFSDVQTKWTPGNEYLWDEYNIESLINTPEKDKLIVNHLIYKRIKKYRELKTKEIDIKGQDPMNYDS